MRDGIEVARWSEIAGTGMTLKTGIVIYQTETRSPIAADVGRFLSVEIVKTQADALE